MPSINLSLNCTVSAESTVQELYQLFSGNWTETMTRVAEQCYDSLKDQMKHGPDSILVSQPESVPAAQPDSIPDSNQPQEPFPNQRVVVMYPDNTTITTIVERVEKVNGAMRVFAQLHMNPQPFFTTFGWKDNGDLCVDYNARAVEETHEQPKGELLDVTYEKVYVAPQGKLTPVKDIQDLLGQQVIVYYDGDVTKQAAAPCGVLGLATSEYVKSQTGQDGVAKVEVFYGGERMWWGQAAFEVDAAGRYFLNYDIQCFGVRTY